MWDCLVAPASTVDKRQNIRIYSRPTETDKGTGQYTNEI